VTHQLLFHADDNFLRENRHTMKKNTKLFSVALRKIGLEENADKGAHVHAY
jgi:hypothetical protein